MKARTKMSKRGSKRAFRSGDKIRSINIKNAPPRGGIRL